MKPLVFLDGNDKNCQQLTEYSLLDNNHQIDFIDEIKENSFEKIGILATLFDDINSTQTNDKDITILTPNRHKIYVEDTPIEIQNLYGLSLAERRKKGLNF